MSDSKTKDVRVRAWIPTRTLDFLREKVGAEEAERAFRRLSPEARDTVTLAKSVDWCSAETYSELNQAVADTAGGDDAKAKKLMIDCGEYVANEATNSFMKLLLKVLTPTLFAKKLPDFWKRDFSVGKLEVKAEDDRLVCWLREMDGLHHVPCTAAGFVRFVLASMGKKMDQVSVHNWSLSSPCSDDARFELTWKA